VTLFLELFLSPSIFVQYKFMARIPLHYQIAEEVIGLLEQGTHRKSYQDRLDNGTIVQVESEIRGFTLPGEIFIASADIYQDLSPAAIKLIIEIQQKLQLNNPLWYCTQPNSRIRQALAQLKRKGILKSIDGTDMYLVNPSKIRKGRPLAVYSALYSYSKKMYLKDKNWRPTTEDIKRLLSPKELEMYLVESRD